MAGGTLRRDSQQLEVAARLDALLSQLHGYRAQVEAYRAGVQQYKARLLLLNILSACAPSVPQGVDPLLALACGFVVADSIVADSSAFCAPIRHDWRYGQV